MNEETRAKLQQKLLPEGLFAVIIAIALVINVILYILTEAFGLYLYSPNVDDLSISGNTDALFANAIAEKRKVKISFCQDEESVKQHSTGGYVYETVSEFAKRYPEFIEVEYINILTRRNSKGELVNLETYKKDMRGLDQNIFKSSVIFEYKDSSTHNYRVLTDSTSTGYADFYTLDAQNQVTSYNGEEVVASMISWVLRSEHKTAYFTQKHGEIADPTFANLITCAGYYIDVIDLKKQEIPTGKDAGYKEAGLVVISNPATDFEKAYEGSKIRSEIDRLETYLENGGNLYVNLDPYVKELPTLEAFLKERGIAFSYSTDKNGRRVRNLVKDIREGIETDGFTLITGYSDDPLAQNIKAKAEAYSDGDVIIREASALELSGNAKPILVSSENSSIEAGGEKIASDGNYCVGAYSKSDAGCVFVASSVYLGVSDSLVTNGYSNKEMIFGLMEELYGQKNMPYGCNTVSYNMGILENLTIGTAINYTVFFMSIPALIAIIGAIVLIRRKNR